MPISLSASSNRPVWRGFSFLAGLSALLLTGPALAESVYSNKCAPFVYISYNGEIQGDASTTTSHKSVSCFAWQQFIALNWPASGQRFGEPGDRLATQWQTYAALRDVFLPGGVVPVAGRRAPLPPACAARVRTAGIARPDDLSVFQAPAGPGRPRARINYTEQAGGQGGEAGWAGASNGTNLWYEIRINREEVDYILARRLYHSEGQAAHVAAGHPVVLPKGRSDGSPGTIELKAAWMEVPDPGNPKWDYFKTADAAIINPEGNDCRLTQVALVGLHIIQKTRNQPTYFWATFEHIDNVPDENGPVSGSHNLYDNQCRPQKIEVGDPRCLADGGDRRAARTVTVSCRPNVRPPYHLGPTCPAPTAIQTTRLVPIQPDVADANRMVQASIAKAHPKSVWKNYKLVNVQWSPSPEADPVTPAAIPARLGGTIPGLPVANTTMETYLQTTTCTACHVNGALARPAGIAADFSFVFQAADR